MRAESSLLANAMLSRVSPHLYDGMARCRFKSGKASRIYLLLLYLPALRGPARRASDETSERACWSQEGWQASHKNESVEYLLKTNRYVQTY